MPEYSHIHSHNYLAWIESEKGLIAIDTGWEVSRGEPYEGSSLEAITKSSELLGKPLMYVLLTHHHWDHVDQLPLLIKQWPDLKVIAHKENPAAPSTRIPLRGGEVLSLDGVRIEAIGTPGHSQKGDCVSYWLPKERFLFCGDLAQPQGSSYENTVGSLSPVPFYWDGSAYMQSLERLMAVDMAAMRTGHGDLLGPEQARQWLRVTYATVNRTSEVVQEIIDKYPTREVDWLCEAVYDQIADERHFGFKRAEARKRHVTDPKRGTDYEVYDKPGIAYWATALRDTFIPAEADSDESELDLDESED